jgi:hypothetical protein
MESFMKFINVMVAASLFAAVPASGGAQTGFDLFVPWEPKSTLFFHVSPQKAVYLTVGEGEVRVDYGDGKDEHVLSRIERETALNGGISLIIDDFNFDGRMDIAVNDRGYGYMGVNIFQTIYIYDHKTGRFTKALETANVEVDRHGKQLLSSHKSGPRWDHITYRFKDGRPFVYKQAVALGNDLFKVVVTPSAGMQAQSYILDETDDGNNVFRPAKRKITVKRAVLYSRPQKTAETRAYLIAGDEVEILAVAGDLDEWFKIHYQGKAPLVRWIRAQSIYEEDQ